MSLFAFISGLFSSLTFTDGTNPTLFQYAVQGISGAVIIAMAIPALLFKQPLKLEESYRVALWLSAVGFLVLPGLTRALPVNVTGVLATTGYMVCGIVLSCTIAEVCKTSQTVATPFFAASDIITLSCLLVGNLLGMAYSAQGPQLNPSQGYFLLAIGGVIYIFVTGVMWLVRHSYRQRKQTPVPIVEATENPEEPVQLPHPEDVILDQLIQGRTMARIAEDLYLSQSAVKYHAQKIYCTYNVHTREELLALFRPTPSLQVARVSDEDNAKNNPTPVDTMTSRYDLSDRESQVLHQIEQGSSMATIAQMLDISQNTVKTHMKHLYKKLGVHSRQEVLDMLQNCETEAGKNEPREQG